MSDGLSDDANYKLQWKQHQKKIQQKRPYQDISKVTDNLTKSSTKPELISHNNTRVGDGLVGSVKPVWMDRILLCVLKSLAPLVNKQKLALDQWHDWINKKAREAKRPVQVPVLPMGVGCSWRQDDARELAEKKSESSHMVTTPVCWNVLKL